jgi:hypothetical protein
MRRLSTVIFSSSLLVIACTNRDDVTLDGAASAVWRASNGSAGAVTLDCR